MNATRTRSIPGRSRHRDPAAVPFAPVDGQLAYLPLDWIDAQPGFNPRTFLRTVSSPPWSNR